MTRSIDRVDDWHFLSGGAGPGHAGPQGEAPGLVGKDRGTGQEA